MNYLEALNRQVPSYPSVIAREFNLIRAIRHLPIIMPRAKIVGITAKASSFEELTRRRLRTGSEYIDLVSRNTFKAPIEEPRTNSPLDVAITPREVLTQATEHNPDIVNWTVKSIALVTEPLLSHENFDEVAYILRTLQAKKTLGRSAGFTGVMKPYYESRYLLTEMGEWNEDVMPSYRPGGVMKTHKIVGQTTEGITVTYEDLFSEYPIRSENTVAQQYFTEATRRSSRMLDVGIPEPIFNQTNGERLLEQTKAIVFALIKNSRRIATILGPDIPLYIWR